MFNGEDASAMDDPTDSATVETALENLKFAITDHQETIRATDVKAEVVAILLTVLVAISVWKGGFAATGACHWINTAAALAALAAVGCVGRVLWPRSDPWKNVPLGNYTPTRVLYPSKAFPPGDTIKSRADLAVGTDWLCELTYELIKLAFIRDAKRRWFHAALSLGAITLLAVAVGLFIPAAGG
jgi:hypothetical protein